MPPAGPKVRARPTRARELPRTTRLRMRAWENLGVEQPQEDVGLAGVIVFVVYYTSAQRMPEIVRMWRHKALR